MLFSFFFFTKFDQMSRVGSRDRHAEWQSKKTRMYQNAKILSFRTFSFSNHCLNISSRLSSVY